MRREVDVEDKAAGRVNSMSMLWRRTVCILTHGISHRENYRIIQAGQEYLVHSQWDIFELHRDSYETEANQPYITERFVGYQLIANNFLHASSVVLKLFFRLFFAIWKEIIGMETTHVVLKWLIVIISRRIVFKSWNCFVVGAMWCI